MIERAPLLACCLTLSATAIAAAAAPHFATTPFLEPDRCATAWVIKRYVHPDAVFSFHPRQELPAAAELFDLPEAELKRDARRSTLEVLVQRSKLTDPLVQRLSRLVHDIEINAWATRREPGSREFERMLGEAFIELSEPNDRLDACFEILDRFQEANGRVEAIED